MNREQRARYIDRIRKAILAECILVVVCTALVIGRQDSDRIEQSAGSQVLAIEGDYIKWVDFTVSYEALCEAYEWDVETHGTEHEICWVDLLAYTAAKTGGQFDKAALNIMDKGAKALSKGEKTLEELTEDLKYFSYYQEAYNAAIGGLVGEYEREVAQTETFSQTGSGLTTEQKQYETVYGLKGYFPLARGFDYTHYDDFGVSRSYGYKRQHLGHDMMGLTGTPTWI